MSATAPQTASGRLRVARDIGKLGGLGEAHERHPAIDVFVLASSDEIGLMPDADVAARILHQAIELELLASSMAWSPIVRAIA